MARSLLLLVSIYHVEGSFVAPPNFKAEPDETMLTSLSLLQLKASRHNRSALMEEIRNEALAGVTCTGGTTPGSTGWVQDSTNTIYVDVDTSACGFTTKPNYVTALGGTTEHSWTRGSSEVYLPTATGFRLYITHTFPTTVATVASAQAWGWHVNWIAQQDTSAGGPSVGVTCAGNTGEGTTAWLNGASGVIETWVDTSACAFSALPSYLSTLAGDGTEHLMIYGSSEVRGATATGFWIHIYKAGLTNTIANAHNWHVNWVAHPEGKFSPSGGVTCAGRTLTADWVEFDSNTLYVDVDTTACGFSTTPRYVTSMGGTSLGTPTGAGEIYGQTASGFRVYTVAHHNPATASNLQDAQTFGWHLNWMALETGVSATEDPHMSNVVGERFNVLRPGTYTFVEVPGGAGGHQLLISARVDQLLDKCHTGGLYVRSMNISGSLLNDVQPLTIDVVSKETDAIDLLHVNTEKTGAMTAKQFATDNSRMATFDQPNSNRQNLKLEVGGVSVNVAGRRQDIEDRNVQIDFLDLRIQGLSAYKNVGGLLGTDDHTFASTAPVECATLMQTVPTSGSANTGSRLLAN